MVIKIKEYFEKTRHVKNNDKSKKYILRGQKMQDIMKKYYQIKRNFIISLNYLYLDYQEINYARATENVTQFFTLYCTLWCNF